MLHRRLGPVTILALVALLLGGLDARAGEKKTFADKNLEWTLPDSDGWRFLEVPDAEKQQGYVARVISNEVGTQMNLMRRPSEGLAPQAFVEEVIGFARKQLEKVKAAKAFQGQLAGKPATCAFVHGEAGGGVEQHASIYVVAHGSDLYLLLVQAFHGAHKKHWKAIDAARRGVRMLEGGGPAEPAATGPLPDADGGGGGEDIGGGTDGTEELDPATWPEKGPKWEEGTIVFPSHNLRWKLPEGTPFKVVGVVDDESAHRVPLVVLRAQQGEDEKSPLSIVTVAALERQEGYRTQLQVNDMNYQNAVASSFHQRLPGAVTLEENIELGGANGSSFGLRGKTKEDAYVSIEDHWVALKGEVYRFRVETMGDRDTYNAFKAPVKALLDGVQFVDTNEPVAGPLAAGIGFHVMPRGSYQGKEYELTVDGIALEKPEIFAKVHPKNSPNALFALEARTEDGSAYMYVEVMAFQTAALNQNRRKPEDFVEEHALTWDEQASGGVKLHKGRGSKGDKTFKAKWAKEKGIGYRFEATFLGHPFVEYGYIVRHRQNTYFIKTQFGGTNAEKKFKKHVKALEKGWDWTK